MTKPTVESDLKRIDAQRDADIDYADILALDAAFFRDARVVGPPGTSSPTTEAVVL